MRLQLSHSHCGLGFRTCERFILRRYACRFLMAGGLQSLAGVVAIPHPPPAPLRYALAALEGTTRSCGAAGCEAVLGWWAPPFPQAAEASPASSEAGTQEDIQERSGEYSGSSGELGDVDQLPNGSVKVRARTSLKRIVDYNSLQLLRSCWQWCAAPHGSKA